MTSELATIECLKIIMYNVVDTMAPSFFDWIFFILVDNKDSLTVPPTTELQCSYHVASKSAPLT